MPDTAPDTATYERSERDLPLGELENLRDVGGYPTDAGNRVRWGLVYRGASVHDAVASDPATAADWAALGVRTAVDLRRPDERGLRGVLAAELHPAGSVSLPLQVEAEHPEVDLDRCPEEFLTAAYHLMLDSGAASVAELFRLLADPDNLPVVVFCAAGKDRTGTVVALLLALLGVSPDDIADDYALSGHRVAAMVARKRAAGDDPDPMVDQHPAILAAPRGAMTRFLEQLESVHGGAAAYLRSVGVTDETLTAVRRNLTENGATA